MKFRILKKDISKNKIVTTILFLFILLAALLVSGAVNIISSLFGAMDNLFESAAVPHYVQLHAGAIDQEEINRFSAENPLVKDQTTVLMLGINGAHIYLGDSGTSQANSIIENSFVTQNENFDYLLDTENNIISVQDGEAAVPLYHMQENNLKIGDTVRIVTKDFSKEFVITAFVRDAQMNPSLVTSKRFVVSENDWAVLYEQFGQLEYSIEFLLHDKADINAFDKAYQASGLPRTGATVNYTLFRVLSALTDGILAAVIILISILLIAISALCLRFTLLAAIEEDYREIGVMKAIGIKVKEIRSLYMIKYTVIAAAASIFGYLISIFAGELFTGNITLYMGTAAPNLWHRVLPLLGAVSVFLAVILFSRFVLRRFRRISAAEAIRQASSGNGGREAKRLRLSRSRIKNVNIFLGLKSVLDRFSMYGILCLIFIICAFLMIVPLNFYNTLKSPQFVSYMGIGQCDIRIDLQQGGDIEGQYRDISAYLEKDGDISKYTALVTGVYGVLNEEGVYENIKVEVGDFSVFPLEYTSGTAPADENQIALSVIQAQELNKTAGDTVQLQLGDGERTLTVSGIYQDITNGGKTAKGMLSYAPEDILWYVVNIEFTEGVSIPDKLEAYSNAFDTVKVTSMDVYVTQTLSGLISRLSLAVTLGFILALAVAVLITALFFKMLIAKETPQIAIMKSLGISYRDIRIQYITRALLILAVGTLLGFMGAMTLGEGLAGLLITGISSLHFIVNPLMNFIVCPAALAAAVGITIFISSKSIRDVNIMKSAQ